MSMTKWFRSLAVVTCLSGVALAPLSEAEAALNAYLKLRGQKTGEIRGSVTQKGRENSIRIIEYTHEVVSPRDPASGLPTGKRQHKPIVIMKEIDKSTPILYSVLVNNENLPTFELDVYMPKPAGVEVKAYTVKLTNASIASIKVVEREGKVYEQVSFTYQRIEWQWHDGGVTSTDEWVSK